MSGKTAITEKMKIEKVIALKGERAEKIIKDYFFDSENLPRGAKKMTLEKAAVQSGKEYKLLGVFQAINNLPEK